MTHEWSIGRDDVARARVGGDAPLLIIAGPCVLEERDLVLRTAEKLASICRSLKVGFVFKCSYLKDNRSSIESFVGPGPEEGLRLLQEVKEQIGVPILSDIHERQEIAAAAEVLDVLQIPAFLCRQTRLLSEASATGCCINVKKGQFLSPGDVRHIIGKYEVSGTGGLLLTERGTSFGYQNLVVDMRGLQIMREFGYPVIFDVTHSLQMPGAAGQETGGDRRFAPLMARAACAAGVDGLFLEAHPDPSRARSDRHTQVPLAEVENLLSAAREFHLLSRRLPPVSMCGSEAPRLQI